MNRAASRLPLLALSVAVLAAALVLQVGCGCSKARQVKGTKYMNDGQDAIAKGQTRKAIVCFEKEIELNPKNPVPYLKLALIYEHVHKDAGKAKRYYEQYLKTETNKTKRERVKRWYTKVDDELPPLEPRISPGPERAESADAALLEELKATRDQLRKADETNDEFAKRIIELEGVQDELETAKVTAKRLTKEHDDLKTQSQTQAASLASLQKTYDELKAKHEASGESSTEEVTDLKDRVTTLEGRNKELEARNEELEAERTRAGRRSLAKKLDEARHALKASEQKNAEYARRIEELEKSVAQLEAAAGTAPRTTTHVVQEGETLRTISLRYYGTKKRWEDIYQANRGTIADPDEIKAGQELIIPLDDSP